MSRTCRRDACDTPVPPGLRRPAYCCELCRRIVAGATPARTTVTGFSWLDPPTAPRITPPRPGDRA